MKQNCLCNDCDEFLQQLRIVVQLLGEFNNIAVNCIALITRPGFPTG
jgi:hypothetical protein